MEFPNFDLRSVLKDQITIWNGESLSVLARQNAHRYSQLCEIIERMGLASAKAQALGAPVTTISKLLTSDQRLYICIYENTVAGILKVGVKKLFININSNIKEISPLCVLDIYVVESLQRLGIGRKIFDVMLRSEQVVPWKIAYDRPSQKLLPFLSKHFQLNKYVPQTNNFVVFNRYFEDPIPTEAFMISNSTTTRPSNSRSSRRSLSAPSKTQANKITFESNVPDIVNSGDDRKSLHQNTSPNKKITSEINTIESPTSRSSTSESRSRELNLISPEKPPQRVLAPLKTPPVHKSPSQNQSPRLQSPLSPITEKSPSSTLARPAVPANRDLNLSPRRSSGALVEPLNTRYKHTQNYRNSFNPILGGGAESNYAEIPPKPVQQSPHKSEEYYRQFHGKKLLFG